MIGIPAAFLAKGWYRSSFSSIRTVILAGRLALPGAIAMHHCLSPTDHPFPAAKTLENEDAAVAFTSGSTGSPKGVVFQHGQFRAQLASMRQDLGIEPGDIHLAAMYIFALFDPALGVSTVIPEMDPRHTAKVDPQGLVEAIESFGVTMMLGAPTVFKRLLSCPKLQPAQLATLKKLFLFGAPVYPPLLQRLKAVMPDALISTPYGATEALPLTLVNAGELASLSTLGQGVCVGTPVPGVALQIIEWSTEVIPVWAKA
jgi:acyl-coenzyme A synthetase/AMP-(fatty) acid ligase